LCDRVGVLRTRLVAAGPPEELAREFWGRTTVVQLKVRTPQILEAIKTLDFVTDVRDEGGRLYISLDDPEERNPAIARAIMDSGGEIQNISEFNRGLEDVYLKLMGESIEV
jgi:ABC-2 type transport system ATP-binding protein